MLFIVDKDKDFFKLNPEAKAVPEFKDLEPEAMDFICLVYDYKSPYRQMPYEKRCNTVVNDIGLEKTPTGRPSKLENDLREIRREDIKKAIDKYAEMQYDDDRDTLRAYDQQIKNIKHLMTTATKPNDMDKAVKLAKEIPNLRKSKKELEELLDMRDEHEAQVNAEQDEIDSEIDFSLVELYNDEEEI